MYNANLPSGSEPPGAARLLKSTLMAAAVATVLLVTTVLPAEYGIDPTGIGRALGLTQMGEIKAQLAQEAAADTAPAEAPPPTAPDQSARIAALEAQLAAAMDRLAQRPAESAAPPPATAAAPAPAPAPAWRDEISIVLTPGQGVEYKLTMKANAEAEFEWVSSGGTLSFDEHGDGDGKSISYQKGRGIFDDRGVIKAAFDGNHGWFWRNRTKDEVTLTLRTRGDYGELKRQ